MQRRYGTQIAPEPRARGWLLGVWRGASGARPRVFQVLALSVVLSIAMRPLVGGFRVEGVSMEPTLQVGQALVVNRAAYLHSELPLVMALLPTTARGSTHYLFGDPQRGDIVVFRAPDRPESTYVKRLIGLPGETVLIQDGHVFIDGQALEEPYVHVWATDDYPPDGTPQSVPSNNYFVLGDNRSDSLDSRLGWFVPAEDLVGRAWIRYWPPTEVGLLTPE